jgi:uncharacterized protein (DUF1697 family)
MTSRPAKPRASRYVALLRAINVGGHVVKMDALRTAFESLRFTNVETFIASGNVIFDAPALGAPELEQLIENELAKRLGYAVATFLRTPQDLASVAGAQPFAAGDPLDAGHALSVGFAKSDPPATAAASLLALATESDDFRVIGREIYWLCRTRVSDSKFSGARCEKLLSAPVTFRNITTVRRLAERYRE